VGDGESAEAGRAAASPLKKKSLKQKAESQPRGFAAKKRGGNWK
jgi:hypothetical protein